jgi:hypothetical protein
MRYQRQAPEHPSQRAGGSISTVTPAALDSRTTPIALQP